MGVERTPCRDRGDLFFDPPHVERADEKAARVSAAKAICVDLCPNREQCLSDALRFREQHDIWGGLTAAERKLLLRQAVAVG